MATHSYQTCPTSLAKRLVSLGRRLNLVGGLVWLRTVMGLGLTSATPDIYTVGIMLVTTPHAAVFIHIPYPHVRNLPAVLAGVVD
jgi:hypothetical protein